MRKFPFNKSNCVAFVLVNLLVELANLVILEQFKMTLGVGRLNYSFVSYHLH